MELPLCLCARYNSVHTHPQSKYFRSVTIHGRYVPLFPFFQHSEYNDNANTFSEEDEQ